jgi:hypothetical protein
MVVVAQEGVMPVGELGVEVDGRRRCYEIESSPGRRGGRRTEQERGE